MKNFRFLLILVLSVLVFSGTAVSQRKSTKLRKQVKPSVTEKKLPAMPKAVKDPVVLSSLLQTKDAIIDTGVSVGYSLPIEPYYGFTYSQSIYRQAEVGAAMTIGRIGYYYSPAAGYEGLSLSRQWKIYMTHTTDTAFADVTSYIPASNLTLVFDETIESPTAAGWIYFDIIPFAYNGTGNLVIAVEENGGGYDDDEDEFLCSAAPDGGNRSIVFYSDDENPEPANPTGTVNTTKFVYPYIPNIVISSPVINNDLKIYGLDYGTSPYSATQQISVIVKNVSGNSQSNFPMRLTVNNVNYDEVYPGTLVSGQVDTFEFAQTFDFTVEGVYYLSAEVMLAADENPGNNVVTASFIVGGSVIIGLENITDESLPIEPYYGYSYSQTIYRKNEIGSATTISRIGYYYAPVSGYEGLSVSNEWKIYMAHTTDTAFATTTSWKDISGFTLVFDGTIPSPTSEGWIYFDLTPFSYNGTDNLVIAVEENQPDYDDDEDEFYCSASPDGGARSLYFYDDSTNPDPASPPTGSTSIYMPNLMIYNPFGNDITVTDIKVISPITASEQIIVTVSNVGTNAQTAFDYSFTFGGNTYTQTFSGSLASFHDTDLVFTQTVDMSASQIYSVTASVSMAGDQDLGNDSYSENINNIYNYNALAFDGNYNSITVTDNALLNPVNITIESWFYTNVIQSWSPIVMKNDWDNDDIGYGMYINNDSVCFFVDHYSADICAFYTMGQWNHVAATYDQTNMIIYINGVPKDTVPYNVPIPVTTLNVNIGTDNLIDYPLDGILDELRIWNVVRTPQEIASDMNYELDTTTPVTGLVLYYPFNQGVPAGDNTDISYVYDFSGNGFDGLMNLNFVKTAGNTTSNFVNSEAFLMLEESADINTCTYDTLLLTFIASGSADMTYQWQSSADGGTTFTDLTESTEFVGTQNDSLYVALSSSNEDNIYQCIITEHSMTVETDTILINLRDVPVATAGSDDQACLTYTLNGNDAGTSTGTWTLLSGTGTFSDPAQNDAELSVSVPGTYNAIWTVENAFCVNSDTVEIVFDEPVIANAGTDVQVCDTAAALNAIDPATGIGTWTSPDATIGDNSLYNTAVSALQPDTNIFIWTVVNGACTDADTAIVISNSDAAITAQPVDLTLNEGQTAIFSVMGDGDVVSFQWQFNGVNLIDGGNVSGATTPTLTIINVTAADAGLYQLIIDGVCNDDSSDVVTLDVITSVASAKLESFEIFPNPTNGEFDIILSNISDSRSKVTIQSIDGRVIYSGNLSASANRIVLQDIASGIYNVQVSADGKTYNQRLIVK